MKANEIFFSFLTTVLVVSAVTEVTLRATPVAATFDDIAPMVPRWPHL